MRAIAAALAGVLSLTAALACAPKGASRQTDIMAKTGAVSLSASELRIRVNALADRMSGRVEATADRIRAQATDHAVRRRALVFKIDAIPAIYSAAYRADPMLSALDVWAFALQISQYLEEGAGRDAFGPQQSLARQGAADLLGDVDAVIESVAARPGNIARSRARLAAWTRQHPIQDTLSARPSVAAFMAEMREERDAFAAVGAAADTLENLSERLNTYAAQLPRQARWQAELMVMDMAGEHDVGGALDDVHALGGAARRLSDLLGGSPGSPDAMTSVRDLVADERRTVLDSVERQRVLTLEYASAERLAVLASLREERLAVAATLQQERVYALQEVDAIKTRTVDTALAGLRDLFDYALWRVALLLACLMVLAAALGVVAHQLTVGRRPRPGTPV